MTDLFIAFLSMVILAMGETAVLDANVPVPTPASLLAPLGVPAVTLLAGIGLGALIGRAARGGAPMPTLYRHIQRALLLVRGLSLVSFAALMTWSDWVLVTRQWVPPDLPFLCRLVAILPFPAAVLIGCLGAGLASPHSLPERARRLALLARELRPLAVALTAFLVVGGFEDVRWHFPVAAAWLATEPGALVVALSACIAGTLVFSPYGLRLAWRTSRLGAGDLRTRFTQLAERARVPLRDIRVWHTGSHGWLNAMIAGVWGRFRCIFMTDALLATLTTPDLEQVFAHELGHARLQHFVIYLLVALTFLLFLTGAERYLPEEPEWQWAVLLGVAFLYLRVFFGALSRQLESESDLFAARLTGSTSGTMSCLVRIGELAGSRPQRRTWRHPSLAQRVMILLRAEESPEFRAAFHSRTRRFLWVLAILLTASGTLFASELVRVARAPAHERDLECARIYHQDYQQRILRPGRRAHMESQLLVLTHDHLMDADRTLPDEPEYAGLRVALLRWLGNVQDLLGDEARGDASRARADALEAPIEDDDAATQ